MSDTRYSNPVKYLRVLKTKDGITSPIQEIFEPRMEELRVVKDTKWLPKENFSEHPDLEGDLPTARRYRVVKQISCVLLEMEEV